MSVWALQSELNGKQWIDKNWNLNQFYSVWMTGTFESWLQSESKVERHWNLNAEREEKCAKSKQIRSKVQVFEGNSVRAFQE